MVTSTSKAKQAADLKHVVDNVIDIEHLDSYLTSISINLIRNFLDASASELEEATRPSPTAGEPNITILPWEVTRIIAFQHYVRYMNIQPDLSLRIQDYETITDESFSNFRATPTFDFNTRSFSVFGNTAMAAFLQARTTASLPAPTATSDMPPTHKKNSVAEFHRAWRDQSVYKILHKLEDFSEWNRSTQIQAKAQRVENVLNPKYMATTPEEIALFDAQKDYMNAVFDKILVLVEGKYIIREMGSNPDPQKVFEKLLYTATKSTAASRKANSLMATFCRIRYGDGSVEPGAKVFVDFVHNLFQQFDQMASNPAEFLTDACKNQHLCNAVQPNRDLRQVATLEDIELYPKAYEYPTYLQRLRRAAEDYDAFAKGIVARNVD